LDAIITFGGTLRLTLGPMRVPAALESRPLGFANSWTKLMKAIVYHNLGSPDVLKCEKIEKPTAGDNEVLITDKGRPALRGKPIPGPCAISPIGTLTH
jgi:hypothetical protein